MINFRYHIISLTAVFMALGIGVALGGTFLDRYTVDLLEGNIGRAEARIRSTEARNRDLEGQVADAAARDGSLITVGSRALFSDRIDPEVPVLVITHAGVDEAVHDSVLRTLSLTGADLRGTLVLEEEMLLDDPPEEVAAAVSESVEDPEAVIEAVNGALTLALHEAGLAVETTDASEGSGEDGGGESASGDGAEPSQETSAGGTSEPILPPEGRTTTPDGPDDDRESDDGPEPEPEPTQPEIVTALMEAGLLSYRPAAGYEPTSPILEEPGYRYVILGDPDPAPAANTMLRRLLPTASARIPAVVIAPTVPEDVGEDAEPTLVERVVSDEELARRYDTVDNIDTFNGLAAMVILLGGDGGGEVGHYGQGTGATALLPGAP